MAKKFLGPIMKKPAQVHVPKAKIQMPKLKGTGLGKSIEKARMDMVVKSFKKAGK